MIKLFIFIYTFFNLKTFFLSYGPLKMSAFKHFKQEISKIVSAVTLKLNKLIGND